MAKASHIREGFTVRRSRLKGLSQAIAQLSEQAEKKALGPINLDADDPTWMGESTAHVVLSTVVPAIGDYELVARIDHLKNDRVYIRPMGETRLDFARIRRDHAAKKCEHCGVRRNRRTTFLIRSRGRGREVQVGSSCLKAYVGESDPRKALLQADLFAQARELVAAAVGGEEQDSPRKMRSPAVDDYLAHVAAVIRSEGQFVRKADVDSEDASTAVIAMENYRLEQLGELDHDGRPAWMVVGRAERTMVSRLKQEFRELTSKTDPSGYDRALLNALDKDIAWPDKQGILATLFERVHALRGGPDRVGKRTRDPWVGEEGERVDVVANLTGTGAAVDSQFGEQVPHYFVTDEGKRITWFATNKHLESDRKYRIRGEVKRHDTFRGNHSTVLTDCRTELLE